MPDIRLGFAMCGSFCTFDRALAAMKECRSLGYDILPILSPAARTTDTRFGRAADWILQIEAICGKPPICDLVGAEPIGPKHMTDILLVAPCTGIPWGKLANGITDNAVTLAVKSHLRGRRPVVLAVSTNDALSGSAKNIGTLLNTRNYYFVPMGQDDPIAKPTSLVADFHQIPQTLAQALEGKQIQPLLFEKK